MNRFLYAEGNPWSMVDPSGHGAYYEGEGCGAGSMYCGSTGFDQNAHNNASQVASTGNSHAHDQPHGPAWTPLATPTTETDRAADNPIFQTTIADRGQDNASLRSSPTCRFAGRAGCVPVGSSSGDNSGLIIVAGVVIGALVCVAGVCEAIAMAATGAAAASGVIAAASAAASGACMVLCDKLQTLGAGINAGLGGSPSPGGAVATSAAASGELEDLIGPTYGQLRSAGLADAHHIIQDAAVRDVSEYSTTSAPAIQLSGPSTLAGTAHYAATQVQAAATVGGTYAAERQVAAMALRAAGLSDSDIAAAIQRADAYFARSLNLGPDSILRIPGNRRMH